MSRPRPIEFRRDEDMTVRVVGGWPEHIVVTSHLIKHADPAFMRSIEGYIFFSVANGSATYKVSGHLDSGYRDLDTLATLEASELDA